MIKESVIQKVKQTADIVNIIERLISIRRKGNNYFGLCPFHHEKTPSFSVSPSRQMYKCFGCGETGDVFEFLQNHQGVSFPEAVHYVAERCGIEVESFEDPNQGLYDLLEEWNNDFIKCLTLNSMAQDYLFRRGITREEVKKFQIGYCPYSDPSDAVLFGYDDPRLLKKVGIVGNAQKLLFSKRITFPIRNSHSSIAGFSGRALSDGTISNKYINSSDSIVFSKESLLYGFKMARSTARLKREMNLTEGYTDVIGMHRAGLSNTVATCGTAFTIKQALLIKSVCPRVNVYYDGDQAGLKAAKRSVGIGLEAGLQVSVKQMPSESDPYSFINAGGDISQIKTMSISDLFTSSEGDSFTKAGNIDSAIAIIAKIDNPVTRDLEINEICRNFNLSYRFAVKRLHVLLNHQQQANGQSIRRASRMG